MNELKNKTYKEVIKIPEAKKSVSAPTNNKNVSNNVNVSNTLPTTNLNTQTKIDKTVDSINPSLNLNTENQNLLIKNTEVSSQLNTLPNKIHDSSLKLNEMSTSNNTSGIVKEKKTKIHQISSNFKPKPEDCEIILESGEKRSCCKLNNCAIF